MRTIVIHVFLCAVLALSAVTARGAQRIYTVPQDIVTLIDEGKYDEARVKLENFRRTYPENPLALFYLAQLEKDVNKANALYKEVEVLADSSLAARALYARAEISFVGNDLAAAAGLYERVISDYPLTPPYAEALYRLGIIRLVSGAHDEARIHFELCLEQNPDKSLRVLAAAGIMESYVAQKEWKTVLESALKVIEQDDDNAVTPRVLEVIALAWHNLGNKENAAHYTERLLKNFPESYQAHAIRARGSSIVGEPLYMFDADTALPDSLAIFYGEEEVDKNVNAPADTGVAENAEFTVQASAFMDKNNALKLFNRLKEANFDTHLSLKTVADAHFYLVQVGYFKTREQAEKMADQVTEFTGIKAHVVNMK